jgi:hypothetical protein
MALSMTFLEKEKFFTKEISRMGSVKEEVLATDLQTARKYTKEIGKTDNATATASNSGQMVRYATKVSGSAIGIMEKGYYTI